MKIHKKLFLALGILASAQAASAATLYFSGYVSNIVVTSQAGGFAGGGVQTGMLMSGSFEYDPAASIRYSGGGSTAEYVAYTTGVLEMTIGGTGHLSTDLGPNTYDHDVQSTLWNRKTYGQDELTFQTSGTNGFADNFAPTALGGTVDVRRYIYLSFKTANYNTLTNASLPTAEVLASNLFTSRTIEIQYNNGVDEPCGPAYEDFCYASNAYQIFTTITSVSTVPLPPSLFLMGTSLSLLALGKRQRRTV